MIRIAVSYNKFATGKSGGARESLLTLLEGAADHYDITIDAYQTPPVDDLPNVDFEYDVFVKDVLEVPTLTWVDQVINRAHWGRFLTAEIDTHHDLLLTQGRLGPASVDLANRKGIPSLLFMRSLALTGYEKYSPQLGHVSNFLRTDLGGKVQYPFLWKNFQDYRRAAKTATHTITNSKFTATKVQALFGAESTVIYPPITASEYRVDDDRAEYITMINPRAEYKGADVFLDVAEALPDQPFLVVGPISSESIQEQAERLPNLTHWGWCEDMREVYSASKVVVVPSRYEEPFGRVAAEAMVSGIPCVVSARGGLPEVVGNTAEIVHDVESVAAWIDAIDRAQANHDPVAQIDRSRLFSTERQIETLLELVESVV